ncbi:22673_t:CDS:2, partial [Gigaspora margarita]
MTCVLGLNCKENVEWLRGYINNTHSNLFEHAKKLFTTEKNHITMINSAKRKARKLDNSEDIQAGLPIKTESWNTSSLVTQALGIQLQEVRNELKNTKKKLHRSLETIQKLNTKLCSYLDSESEEDENYNESSNISSTNMIQLMVNNLIKNGKLGSTIFVNTNVYLTLILNQPCPICYNVEIINKKPSITVNGLAIKLIIKCLNCKTTTEYSNESPEMDFSTSVAAAGLVGGVNREEWRSMLALIGITRQSGKSQYFAKQDQLFDGLKNEAVNSAQKALYKVLDKLIENKQFNLEVSFDCQWSHVREAPAASGEFIYNGLLNENDHKPIIGFHVAEKPRKYQKTDGQVITINEGNHNSNSSTMEHAILIAIIEQISPALETSEIVLDVGIDGDLNSNKTLGAQKIVHKICADLKHKAKNVRAKIAKNNKWKHLESPIMKYYVQCVYAATARTNDPNLPTPTEEDLFKMQTEGVIAHLQNNHKDCWNEVCWFTENPDMILPEPNLMLYTKNQCEVLLKDLKQYMKLSGQGLITTIRTSANEAVNRIKLNYTDKKTDYPKSFSARHALAVLHNNDGLLTLLETVRKVAKLPEFSEQDIINIIKIWKSRNDKRQLNINTINERNKSRSTKFEEQKKRVNDEMLEQKFRPTFASLIQDFDIFVKCNGCLSFPIKYPIGLCSICGFWAKYNMNNYIPIQTNNNISSAQSSDTDILDAALKNIFNLSEYQEYQKESIESFINGHNTLTILKTGGGKTLIYAHELIYMGIPAATFYASSEQPPELQERIFSELASGLIKILLITPEKYILNIKFRNMLKKINSLRGLQFVVDEAHCVKEYEHFRNSWTKLNVVKYDFPFVPMLFLTATCTLDTAEKLRAIIAPSKLQIIRSSKIYRSDLKLEVISKPRGKEKLVQAIISIIDSIPNGRVIIYSASVSDCITVGQLLSKHYESQNIGIYHG